MDPTYTPFLTTRDDGTLAYEAAVASDLRRLFNILKLALAIALRITELKLNEELDGPRESGILDFAYEYGSITEAKPFDDNDCESAFEVGVNHIERSVVLAAPAVTANLPLTSTPTLATIPEDTDSMDTEMSIDSGDLDSVFSTIGSKATITGLANTARPRPPHLTAATVEKRLQETVDDFALVLEMSCIEDGDEILAALYLKLLRALLKFCGNVTLLEVPQVWFDVIHEMSFPGTWCVTVRGRKGSNDAQPYMLVV